MLMFAGIALYLDWRIKGDATFLLYGSAAAIGAGLLYPVASRVLGPVLQPIPGWIRGLVLAGLPAAWLFVTRWRGELPRWQALAAVALPLVTAAAMGIARPRLQVTLGPLLTQRDQLLPRWLRVVLAAVIPTVLVFWLVHGSLRDIAALFGAPTRDSALINAPGTAVRLVAVSVASTVIAFLLLLDPPRRPHDL